MMDEFIIYKEDKTDYSATWLDQKRVYKKNPIEEVFHMANGKCPKTTKRVCFLLNVKKDCVDKYIFEHQ